MASFLNLTKEQLKFKEEQIVAANEDSLSFVMNRAAHLSALLLVTSQGLSKAWFRAGLHKVDKERT